jgi:cytochrome o ubiquinol oxidase operon protein cyoD
MDLYIYFRIPDGGKMNTAPRVLKVNVIGFLLCILLTLLAYLVVDQHLLTGRVLAFTIVGLGLLQAFVQLFFFLHLGQEPRPRWNLHFFLMMASVLLILVFGSLWIMDNLNYRAM